MGGRRCWWKRLLDGGKGCWDPVPASAQRMIRLAGRDAAEDRRRLGPSRAREGLLATRKKKIRYC
uniref:Uncharacterized protein n=1 Tax=Triticum urartu TaxID=4572 RepID=A0A8R7QBW2_TRIUA